MVACRAHAPLPPQEPHLGASPSSLQAPQNMAWETPLRPQACCSPPPWPLGNPPGVMGPQPPLPSPVGAAAWERKAPRPAAPPHPPLQSASSPSASHRPLEAPATFQRPSPTPCSWPGPWQSPYGLGPPCADCPRLTAGLGSKPGGDTDPAHHTRTCGVPTSLPAS